VRERHAFYYKDTIELIHIGQPVYEKRLFIVDVKRSWWVDEKGFLKRIEFRFFIKFS